MIVPAGSGRDALQAALATGLAELEAGEYVIDTLPGRRPYASIAVGSSVLRGAGPETRIRFIGDCGQRDWCGLGVTDGTVSGLTLDTSGLVNTSEQTHATRITGPAMGPTIEHVVFDHPVRGAERGGDGVQIVGYSGSLVVSARIANCTFLRCDRSGVAAHSGAHALTIEDCDFIDVGDQDIDGEGSGDHRDWLIARNRFRLGPVAQGDMSIQLHKIDGCRVTDNRFGGRGIYVLSGSNVEIDGNSILRSTAVSGVGAIEIEKASAGVHVHHNAIMRVARAGLGYVIRTMPREGFAPSDVRIEFNTLVQMATGSMIDVTAGTGLRVIGNTMVYGGPPLGGYAVNLQGATTIRVEDTAINGNVILGPLTGCVGVNGGYGGAGAVNMTGNTAIGPTYGLRTGNVTPTTGPITASDNDWPKAP